jgi:hypothetical protein
MSDRHRWRATWAGLWKGMAASDATPSGVASDAVDGVSYFTVTSSVFMLLSTVISSRARS